MAWMVANRWSWQRFAVLGIGVALFVAVLIGIGFGREDAALPAFWFRVDMARVSLHLTTRNPIFGLGLDEFRAASIPLITPETVALFPPAANGENAHNNFLQILVELGAAGLAAFLWLLVTALVVPLMRIRREGNPGFLGVGLAAGVFAFLVTCVMGHPLLVPEAALPFFLMLGLLAAALPDAASDPSRPRRVAAISIGTIAIAMVIRLASRI
jgi:O-antigen ligase